MDNKYQDIHIKNWQTHKEIVFREVQIKTIEFRETRIAITYIDYQNIEFLMTFDKEKNQLIID